jgi:hypothetical protein
VAGETVQVEAEHYPKLVAAISKLAVAGELAGLTISEMIGLLNDGLSIESLIDIIASRLDRMGLLSHDETCTVERVM